MITFSLLQITFLHFEEDERVYKLKKIIISKMYPSITCNGDQSIIKGATHEIHIFLTPINPDQETLNRYFAVVEEWNVTRYEEERTLIQCSKMKACHLSLEFHSSTNVRVMQSARFVYENDMNKVIEASHRDAKWFESHGLSVVREKIEASAYGNLNIPQTNDEVALHPNCYFEFHIKVAGEEASVENLRDLAGLYSKMYGVPVPFSHNLNPNQFHGDKQGHQLYFNMRFRNMGLKDAENAVANLKTAIDEQQSSLKVVKTISEYVWFDTYCALDKGWIE